MTDEDIEKKVGERINVVMSDPDLSRAYLYFGGEMFRRSSVYHGLGPFLKRRDITGDTCFEIGSWNGLTAAVLARHFRRVVSVDIADRTEKYEVLKFLGVENVEFITIKNNAEKRHIADRLSFDFAYLDGDHANDTYEDWDMCRKSGRILFHEAWPHQPPVWHLLLTLDPKKLTWGGDGLALWRG